ncbi:MAG: peptidoglycan editing factor PgeF [Acetobacteraceae bacterium]|nr:peptidoglycan editing factor PgeF [Pseudomonadota bacterium]
MPDAVTHDALDAPHGFFTRRGGVSAGAFASLNCSLSSPDDPASVRANRARVAHAIGVPPERLVGLTQVHGTAVITVTEPWAAGAGPKADAMVTDRPDVALGIVTADCAPVLFVDAGRNIVGAAHAGWRGAVAGVLEATVHAMAKLGANPAAVAAVIGPCIAQPSYEVAADLRDAVLARCADDSVFFAPGRRPERWQFNLSGYCAARLRAAGVAHVEVTGHDTVTQEDQFFSHRRRTLLQAGPIGHQISVIRPA